MGAGTRAVAYVRVSTDKQVEHGLSLEAQQAKLMAYATLYELDLVAMEVDAGVSAKTLQRPALQQALGALKAGKAEALLVVKLDRLTRSVRDLGLLVETYFLAGKWSLMSVSEQIDTRHRGRPHGAQYPGGGEPVGARNHRRAHGRGHGLQAPAAGIYRR